MPIELSRPMSVRCVFNGDLSNRRYIMRINGMIVRTELERSRQEDIVSRFEALQTPKVPFVIRVGRTSVVQWT